jgi:hypothetical protein
MEIIVNNWEWASSGLLVLCTVVLAVLHSRTLRELNADKSTLAKIESVAESLRSDVMEARTHFDDVVSRLPKRRAKKTDGGEG